MAMNEYPHQNLSLKDIKGEKWQEITGLEGYFMVSNLGRVKRLEYEMEYRNGSIYIKPEKIIKPSVIVAKNKFKNDITQFLVNRVTLHGTRYNLTLSRLIYDRFVAPFNLEDNKILILCKDGNGLNVHPGNLVKSGLSGRAQRIVERGRMESPFKNLSKEFKEKQRKAIVQSASKTVTQYSLKGKKIKTYSSAAAAEKSTGVFATSIGQRASGRGISAGGYVWRWGKEKVVDIESVKKERLNQKRILHGKKVTQYELNGNLIAQFTSLQDAEATSGTNANAIRLVLKGVYKSAGGYFWLDGYGKEKIDLSKHKWGKQSMAANHSKQIKQLSIQGKLIKVFPSVKEAALSVNVTASVIIGACKGRQKTSAGFRWQYA